MMWADYVKSREDHYNECIRKGSLTTQEAANLIQIDLQFPLETIEDSRTSIRVNLIDS